MDSGNLVPTLDSSSKQIYDIFLVKKQIPPTAKGMLTDKYPNANLEWISGLTYIEVVVVAIGSDRLFRKLYRERELQWKIVNIERRRKL